MAPDVIVYPTIVLNGTEVPIKFRVGDILRLQTEHQIDFFEAASEGGIAGVKRTLALLSVGISHQVEMTTDQLADAIDWADMGDISSKLGSSIKKASERIQLSLGAAAPPPTKTVQ